MGKVVKYCTVCEEGFAEKFSFCPNCAAALTAYEMKPVIEQTKTTGPLEAVEPVKNDPVPSVVASTAPSVKIDAKPVNENVEPIKPKFLKDEESEILDLNTGEITPKVKHEEPVVNTPVVPAVTIGSFDQPYNGGIHRNETQNFNTQKLGDLPKEVSETQDVVEKTKETQNFVKPTVPKTDFYESNSAPLIVHSHDDGVYRTTLIEEKNSSTRQMLLLGAFLFVMFLTFGGVIVSLFTSSLNVGSINDDSVIAYLPGESPDLIEEEEKPKPKTEDKAGGGGGGGKKDPTPTSQGEFARQTQMPTVPPSAKMDRVTNPEIKQVVATQGPENNEPPKDRYGNPNSTYTVASDGTGSGGGQGEGTGRGQGNGRGTGRGNGNGSGIGNGNGNGIGNGDGDGVDGVGGPPPEKKVVPKVTTPLKITAKPKGLYTDAARQNQVQGTVRLRVVFNANGSIGSISVVSGLGNGLTEKAIEAARGIRFEPQLVNGVAQTVTKQIDYTFTLY